MKKKATQLPKLFEAAFSKNTLLKYKSAWHKWVEWSANYAEVNHCPADPFFICLYFNDLVMTNSPISTVITAIYGIRWGHINSGFKSPTDNPIVKLAFEGAKKIIGKARVNKKEPFTAEIIKKLVSIYGDTESLMALRFLIICVVGFAGFFRINELLKLKIIDLVETKDSFEITVKESKTDQLRELDVAKDAFLDFCAICFLLWNRWYPFSYPSFPIKIGSFRFFRMSHFGAKKTKF